MNERGRSVGTVRVVIVQPVQSPYWTVRLKELARHTDLKITLLLERGSFAHRPGWRPEAIEGVDLEILGSTIVSNVRKGDDLGYRIEGIRSIPWRLISTLWRLRPDVVVVCNATEILLALPLRRLVGFQLALIVEDTPHASRNLGKVARPLKQWAYRHANGWFAFSEDARRYLEQIGITYGVERSSWSLDTTEFRPANDSGGRKGNSQGGCGRKVVFVGALVGNKGVDALLASWRDLSLEARGRHELWIVGSGPLRNQLEKVIAENGLDDVSILGQVSYADVRDLLQKADLLVLPTLQDLFSLTVLEAMASGCPVITTPFNGARELVEEEVNGWIVDPTQPGALTAALARALSPDIDLRQMGLAARARVEGMDNVPVMRQFAESLRKLAWSRDPA